MRASETERGREASGNEFEACTFPVTHVYTLSENMFVFFKSSARVCLVQPRKTP